MSSTTNGTALAVYDRVADPMVACEKMAKPVAALVGCSPEQGAAIMLACLCDGITPFDFARKYHMIQGRPTMKSGAMLDAFHRMGGKHEILRRSPEGASVKLTIDGEEYISTLTWEEAQHEDFTMSKPDKQGKRHVKENYAYPRKRMQMLWARVISDGVEALRPGIRHGLYTPEEIGDVIEGEFSVSSAPPQPSAAELIQGRAAGNGSSQSSPPAVPQPAAVVAAAEDDDDFVDAEPLGDGFCTAAQSQRIHDLFVELNVSHEKQQQILTKRNAQAVRNLTKDEAQQVIDRLEFAKSNSGQGSGDQSSAAKN